MGSESNVRPRSRLVVFVCLVVYAAWTASAVVFGGSDSRIYHLAILIVTSSLAAGVWSRKVWPLVLSLIFAVVMAVQSLAYVVADFTGDGTVAERVGDPVLLAVTVTATVSAVLALLAARRSRRAVAGRA